MTNQISRREQERILRREHMLSAARAIFAERGFKRATIDEIAQRSEFGKGTIYNYFPGGKDEMLFAILDDVYDDIYSISVDVFQPARNGSFAHSLERYVEASIEYFQKEEDLFVILMKETNRLAFGDDPSVAVYFREQFDRIRGVLEPVIEFAIANGELKGFTPHGIAHLILGNIHGYLRYNCLQHIGAKEGDASQGLSAREAARFISEMLLHGLAKDRDEHPTERELSTEPSHLQ